MAEHSILAPSGLHQLVQCPGSVALQQAYPDVEGPAAIEGTAAHWFGAELVRKRPIAVGQIAPNGVVCDEEMLEGAELWAETCAPHLGAGFVETRVPITRVHPLCWGTPDYFAWRSPRHLLVADYKYGFDYVEVFENPQLVAYAAGALEYSQIDGLAEQGITVEFVVVQPRSYGRDPVRRWTVPAVDLRAQINVLRMQAEIALSPTPYTKAGPACKHCTARHACETLQRASLDVVDQAGQAVALELTTPQAAHELRRLLHAVGMANARVTGLEAQLLAAARKGEPVPNFHVGFGQGREVWTKPDDEIFALGDLMGVDLRKTKPITPIQARDKGISVDGFSERKTGEAKLVLDSPHTVARVFGS